MKKLLIATGNLGKIAFIKSFLEGYAGEVFGLGDLGLDSDAPEDFDSNEENAFAKASYYFEKSGGEYLVFAEDAGIEVEALPRELGVKTRRFGLGVGVSDEVWLEYFLDVMKSKDNRRAKFVSVGCVFDGVEKRFFRGVTEGILLDRPQVELEAGLPLSSIFLPDGFDKVFSAMSKEEKIIWSHRGRMLREFGGFLGV